MPATPRATRTQTARPTQTATPAKSPAGSSAQADVDANATVRLHITPFTPELLAKYIAPSVLPLAKNISYHTVETFPEKGFGYVELPAMEAQKLKKKLNGSTLKGSKVRIEDAKPEKRKAGDDAVDDQEGEGRPVKRSKKEKRKKEQGVLEGVELPEDRKVKRGWTEPPAKNRKDKKHKADKKDKKAKQKESKYTKEPEMLFKAKLTPTAATEVASKEKKDKKKDKKKSKSSREVTVHEFEKSKKQPSFLKATESTAEKKPAVEYVNGKGWVDEDGNVVEAETGKARNRRQLELVDNGVNGDVSMSDASPQPTIEVKASVTPDPGPLKPATSAKLKKGKRQKVTPPPSSSSDSESDVDLDAESSEVSSDSESDSDASDAESDAKPAASPAPAPEAPQLSVTPSSPDGEERKEIHPLESIFKRPKPPALGLGAPTTPGKLAPINTSFSFFENENMDVDADASGNLPVTPFTQKDLEWRGLRSAAPTPDTAAIGRRFSFDWRRSSSHEVDDEDEEDEEAGRQLSNNTKANTSVPDTIAEEDEDEEEEDAEAGHEQEQDDEEADDGEANAGPLGSKRPGKQEAEGGEEESEFSKWFWENRGENNRAWKKNRREGLKVKRLRENKKITSGRVGR